MKNLWIILVLGCIVTGAASSALGCYAVVVGKEASADGSVLFGHNEQNGGRRMTNFRRIPRMKHAPGEVVTLRRGGTLPEVEETYAFLWSEMPGLEFCDAYMNEWGVAVSSDGCPTRENFYEALVARGDITDGGIGYMLRRLIVQRARTAREGVRIAGELLERFGYSDSGRTLTIADPNEAWLLSIVRGKHWVAQRVPDDGVVLLPNVHIISEIDLSDSEHFMGAPDVVEYAIERGWFDPAKGEPFRFNAAYNRSMPENGDPRRRRGQSLVTGQVDGCGLGEAVCTFPPSPPKIERPVANPLPFSVRPDRKLTVGDVAAILRYHGPTGTLCGASTQEAAVFQLRSGLPPEIGCVYWRNTAEPCCGVLTPWYAGITETPEAYYRPSDVREALTLSHHFDPPAGTFDDDPRLLWWTFKALQDWVNKDYAASIKKVRAVWDDFEEQAFARQPEMEKEALERFQKDPDLASVFLTKYSKDLALRAVELSNRMIRELSGEVSDER